MRQWRPGKSGSNRVNRGGSWNNDAANLRVANRNNNTPDNRNNNVGFRLSNTGDFASMKGATAAFTV